MSRIWRKSSAEEYNKAIPNNEEYSLVNDLSRGSCLCCNKTFRFKKGYWVFLTNSTPDTNRLGLLGYWVCCSEECFNICVLTNKNGFFV